MAEAARVWRHRTGELVLDRTRVMGILNVTPDSFSDGGRYFEPDAALRHGVELVEQGADLLDVGGESTRPGCDAVSGEEEWRRIGTVIHDLAAKVDVPLSIDTMKAAVAAKAIDAGASLVNDVSGLRDPAMVRAVAERKAGVVVMHMSGNPKTMQEHPQYADVAREVRAFLADRIRALEAAGVRSVAIATVCSHSSLQIFHGARQEGFRTLGIAIGKRPRFYDAFPLAKPDDFLIVDSYADIVDQADDLVSRHVVTVPHGSFVEYMGSDIFAKLRIPTFGNREVLRWESDREKQREWLTSAGVPMPDKIERPQDIDRPVFVKYYGAKGGRGSFIAKNYEDFKESIQPGMKYAIQEYVVGTRYYMHYFYSPLAATGYRLSQGALEMLGVDRRDEANIDEMYKLGAQEALRKMGLLPTVVVTGNMPVVLRESLLPIAFDMGERVVERSLELFGGMIGPFCLETIVTDKLAFKVFEISTRIVAGTNLFIAGSPYSDLTEPGMSTGRRIAREIRIGQKQGRLEEILS